MIISTSKVLLVHGYGFPIRGHIVRLLYNQPDGPSYDILKYNENLMLGRGIFRSRGQKGPRSLLNKIGYCEGFFHLFVFDELFKVDGSRLSFHENSSNPTVIHSNLEIH